MQNYSNRTVCNSNERFFRTDSVVLHISFIVEEPGRLHYAIVRARIVNVWATVRIVVCALALALPMVVTIAEAPPAAAAGRTWYVSGSGDDAADGQSTQTAWRSLGRLAQQRLQPGDAVLLQGGATFSGSIFIGTGQAGDARSPVRIGSYGQGRATIAPVDGAGVVVYNTAGVDISDLRIVGNEQTLRAVPGINAYNDLSGDRRLSGLHIRNVQVSGFKIGVAVGGGNGASGFDDVAVHDSLLHGNLESGLALYGPVFNAGRPAYAHTNVVVSGVWAYDNQGDPQELARNTGSGIILGSVRGGLVDRSRASNNGALCRAPEGPVGIWAYDSDQVTIQRSISDNNRSGGPADGDGFDLDQNVSRSVLQGNLSFANDGAGFLIYTAQANDAHRDNLVRFNVSVNDGRKIAWYGAITAAGRVSGTRIEHNTVIVRATPGGRPPALRLEDGLSGVSVRNNILLSDTGGPLVQSASLPTQRVLLQGNDYAAFGTPWSVVWGPRQHGSLQAWRAATGQERRQGLPTGTTADPQLRDRSVVPVAGDSARVPTDVPGLAGLALGPSSPVRGAGLFGTITSAGVLDVFGAPVPMTRPPAIGAHQP